MPSHSEKQAKVMSAITHGWHPTGSAAHIPLRVAQEFHAADKGHKYGKGMAFGGAPLPKLPMKFPRYGAGFRGIQGLKHLQDGGFINSDVPGRTDKHYVTVNSGSYVLPADHVSALGQNNSNAGAEVVRNMFGPGSKFGPRLAIPRFAGGGGVEPVPIVVAGGEIVLPPNIVRRIGNGDIARGHEVLDRWVLATRKKHIDKLKSLKPPKGADEK